MANFLNERDIEFYKKGVIYLSQNFGVGAYAYFRRMVENEILRIIEFLSSLETSDAEKVKEIYERYKVNKQMSNLIDKFILICH